MKDEDLKITIYIKDKNNLLATANLCLESVFFGFITLKGFTIWKSPNFNERLSEAINITPTSQMWRGRPIKQVYFEDDKKWFELELLIYNAYIQKRNKSKSNSEDVNIDEIPID